MKSVHLWIIGRVQGVGYRAWLYREAVGQGLSGWARNRSDGAVEAVLAGDPVNVDTVVAACHDGPPGAMVQSVTVNEAPPPPGGFEVRPTL